MGLVPGCSLKTPVVYGQQDGRVISVPAAEVDAHLEKRRGIWVQSPGREKPIILVKLDSGELRALNGRCTHQGCPVLPTKRILACQCHGGRFNFDGEIRGGPVPRPLTVYTVERAGDTIRIIL